MALPVWGNLEKSQVDDETIEEAIDRRIQDHEDDSDAHIEIGESLQSHKASEIIDHLISSIVADKIAKGAINLTQFSMEKLNFFTCFETFDGWNNIDVRDTSRILGAQIAITDVGAAINHLWISPIVGVNSLIWSKNPFFQLSAQVKYNTNQDLYFGLGTSDFVAADDFVGFKIEDDTLYAIIVGDIGGNRTEYTTEITGIEIRNINIYRAEYDDTEDEVKFYVNGVLKATKDVIPTLRDETQIFSIFFERTAAENKSFHPNYLLWSQDL